MSRVVDIGGRDAGQSGANNGHWEGCRTMLSMSLEPRTRLRRSMLRLGACLIFATGFSAPGFANAIEISALTPGVVAGFNDETIQDFIRQNPDDGELRFNLSVEDRQEIVALGLVAAEFRQAIVRRGLAQGGSLTDDAKALLTGALGLGQGGPPPVLWETFFAGSVVSLGNALGSAKRVGFYNPVVDGWLMTDWTATDAGLSLTGAHVVTGAVLRGETEDTIEMPTWTKVSDMSVVGALAESHRKSVESFRAIHPVASREPLPSPEFDTRAQRQAVEIRLGALRRSLSVLGRPALTSATQQFLDALYSGDPMRLADLVDGGSTASVHWVNGLLTPMRDQFRPTGVVRQGDDVTVMFGIPQNGRWLLLARYGQAEANGAAKLTAVSFIDLVTAENGRAVP